MYLCDQRHTEVIDGKTRDVFYRVPVLNEIDLELTERFSVTLYTGVRWIIFGLTCSKSELLLVGMEGIPNFYFKQRGIPDYCDDPVPHKYRFPNNMLSPSTV